MANKIEGVIEKHDLSCRVYSEFRSATMGAVAINRKNELINSWY